MPVIASYVGRKADMGLSVPYGRHVLHVNVTWKYILKPPVTMVEKNTNTTFKYNFKG